MKKTKYKQTNKRIFINAYPQEKAQYTLFQARLRGDSEYSNTSTDYKAIQGLVIGADVVSTVSAQYLVLLLKRLIKDRISKIILRLLTSLSLFLLQFRSCNFVAAVHEQTRYDAEGE